MGIATVGYYIAEKCDVCYVCITFVACILSPCLVTGACSVKFERIFRDVASSQTLYWPSYCDAFCIVRLKFAKISFAEVCEQIRDTVTDCVTCGVLAVKYFYCS